MSVDIIKFAVAVQNWFERFGGCNAILQMSWKVPNIIILNIITIIIINTRILALTVLQLQCDPLNKKPKYTYFSS